MKAYVGQTRSRSLLKALRELGIGECCTRGQLPPRRDPWFYDNGAFEDFQAGAPFDYLQFSRDMRAIRLWADAEGIPPHMARGGESLPKPDFIVVPDVVAGGLASLDFSAEHLDECLRAGAPCYLAVQDGMTPDHVRRFLDENRGVAGLFVGGSLDWKLATGATWTATGRRLGLPVHVGRVGTADRVRWAHDIGADSIDSALPLWSERKLDVFVDAWRTR